MKYSIASDPLRRNARMRKKNVSNQDMNDSKIAHRRCFSVDPKQ
jgi:hypothetical protein